MVKKAIGYLAIFTGSLAILISAIMLTITVIIPFLVEGSSNRGVSALAIMETGNITLGYYGYTLGMFMVMLSLGVVAASLGRYVVDVIED